ncbi:2-octaprenyl-6-methoxyphenol hydroxylase [Burkholderiales bacterium]|nr:MAG: 2-polyprenyl-6-methoxyphenol hydroxylase [Burkholderiales bacterium]CAG0988901.1 2-octaprenyl-6-methoxyphenol hydroxylase [Burkholderiales bacterium]
MFDRDLLIAGAGPVGATLALALRQAEFAVCLCEARTRGEAPRSERVLALSHGSRLILERLGVWSRLALSPGGLSSIARVEVSQYPGAAQVIFSAAELGLPALGYVLSYRDLVSALDAALLESGVTLHWRTPLLEARGTASYAWFELGGEQAGAGTARLVAIADGAPDADAWQRDYHQRAILCEVAVAEAQTLAIERFTEAGPIALLPRGQRHALVWTLPERAARDVLALDDAAFLARLTAQFGTAPGRFSDPGPRQAHPLALRLATRPAQRRLARLGNAAQTLHPVAGQGYNLGLRDAYELAQCLLDDKVRALGSERQLRRYLQGRRSDRWGVSLATHGLIELFASSSPSLVRLREQGMQMLAATTPLRRLASHVLMHGLR